MARNEKFRGLPEVEKGLRVRVGNESGRALSGGRVRELWVAGARELEGSEGRKMSRLASANDEAKCPSELRDGGSPAYEVKSAPRMSKRETAGPRA